MELTKKELEQINKKIVNRDKFWLDNNINLIDEAIKKQNEIFKTVNDWIGLEAFIRELLLKIPVHKSLSKTEDRVLTFICRRQGKIENIRKFVKELNKSCDEQIFSLNSVYGAIKTLYEKELFVFPHYRQGSAVLKVYVHPKTSDNFNRARK